MKEKFQVGDRVFYLGFTAPELGRIARVHVVRSDDSPDASETYRYDSELDGGGSLLQMNEHIERAL